MTTEMSLLIKGGIHQMYDKDMTQKLIANAICRIKPIRVILMNCWHMHEYILYTPACMMSVDVCFSVTLRAKLRGKDYLQGREK